jgi:hypothetical protein
MDLDNVEDDRQRVQRTDTVTINDLTGTDATEIVVNLAGVIGGAGDARTSSASRQQRREHYRRLRRWNFAGGNRPRRRGDGQSDRCHRPARRPGRRRR